MKKYTIKPLEFHETSDGHWEAYVLCGQYEITKNDNGFDCCYEFDNACGCVGLEVKNFDKAKDRCFKHWQKTLKEELKVISE